MAGRFVGNAFMHSASVTFLLGYVEWIIVGKSWNLLPTNEPRMFTDVSERMNPFPMQTQHFFNSITPGDLRLGRNA